MIGDDDQLRRDALDEFVDSESRSTPTDMDPQVSAAARIAVALRKAAAAPPPTRHDALRAQLLDRGRAPRRRRLFAHPGLAGLLLALTAGGVFAVSPAAAPAREALLRAAQDLLSSDLHGPLAPGGPATAPTDGPDESPEPTDAPTTPPGGGSRPTMGVGPSPEPSLPTPGPVDPAPPSRAPASPPAVSPPGLQPSAPPAGPPASSPIAPLPSPAGLPSQVPVTAEPVVSPRAPGS